MNRYNSKKVLSLIAIAAAAILAAVMVNYRITQHVLERTVIAQQEDIAAKATNTVEFWLNQQMKILEAAANAVDLNHLDGNTRTMVPLEVAMQAGDFTDVYIGTPEVCESACNNDPLLGIIGVEN